MTQNVMTATDISEFSPDDRHHIEAFRRHATSMAFRDEASITLPSGKRVSCKSLKALEIRAEVDA